MNFERGCFETGDHRSRHVGTAVLACLGLLLLSASAEAQFQLNDPTAGDEPGSEEFLDEDESDGIEGESSEDNAGDAGDEDSNESDAGTGADDEASQGEGAEPEALEGEAVEEAGETPDSPDEESSSLAELAAPEGIGTTTRFQLDDPSRAAASETDSRFLFPPVLIEESGGVSTTAVFPFFYRSASETSEEWMIPPYYRRRSDDLNVDVLFPLFWSFRGLEEDTLVIPPFYFSETETGSSYGLPPLFFHSHDEASEFTLIPPLLTAQWGNEDSSYTIAGPFWRHRDDVNVDWGLFPFLWVLDHEFDTSVIAPPFYFRLEDAEAETALTVVPPVYVSETAEHTAWGVAPLFHHYTDDDGFSLTIPPLLFHYGEDEESTQLITPLFGYVSDENSSTLITPLYQNQRGETQFDSVAPFFFWSRNPTRQSQSLLVPPFVWHFEDPVSTTTVGFPFFARFHETGRYTTLITPLFGRYESEEEDAAGTWIFPNIQVSHTPTSSTFNLHPLLYSTSADTHRHLVLPPLFWDFEDYEDDSRVTVGFPIFWRFQDRDSVTQLALNTYYRRVRRDTDNPGWEFHFFPLFAFGEDRPGSHWWSVLYGLAGFERQGSYARAQAFWIPFEVDSPD